MVRSAQAAIEKQLDTLIVAMDPDGVISGRARGVATADRRRQLMLVPHVSHWFVYDAMHDESRDTGITAP